MKDTLCLLGAIGCGCFAGSSWAEMVAITPFMQGFMSFVVCLLLIREYGRPM